MNSFGMTMFGPQNYFLDMLREEYTEPMSKEEVPPLMELVSKYTTLPKSIQRPDVNVVRLIDLYIGRVNGFAYGSTQRFIKMKRKGVIKPVFPCEVYRLPPTSQLEYGWWQHDPVLQQSTWQKNIRNYRMPVSPNTLILDKARRNNKYASLF